MGFTQRQAAQALGMKLSNYSLLVTGKRVRVDKRTELACAAIEAGATFRLHLPIPLSREII